MTQSNQNQPSVVDKQAAIITSKLEMMHVKPDFNRISMQTLGAMGQLSKIAMAKPAGNDEIRVEHIMGDIMVNTIIQAAISNGIAAEAYKLSEGKLLNAAWHQPASALIQATYCQYRVHAASHDLWKMKLGENPMEKDQFDAISHERAESLVNLYNSLRTFAMLYNLDLEQCLVAGVRRYNNKR